MHENTLYFILVDVMETHYISTTVAASLGAGNVTPTLFVRAGGSRAVGTLAIGGVVITGEKRGLWKSFRDTARGRLVVKCDI